MHAVEETSSPNHKEFMNFVFANRSDKTAIYPLTVREIAIAQTKDKTLDKLTLLENYNTRLVENTHVLCKEANLSSQRNYKSVQ